MDNVVAFGILCMIFLLLFPLYGIAQSMKFHNRIQLEIHDTLIKIERNLRK